MTKPSKLKLWNAYSSWEDAEKAWDLGAKKAAQEHPIKGLAQFPKMPGITEETAKNLKWKSFKWMLTQDHKKEVLRGFLKHPFRYGLAFLKSIFRKKSYVRAGDFFLYGIQTLEEFKKKLLNPNSLLVCGFSYCHKPFECPSGRFSDSCVHEESNPVCRQCFIGKCVNSLPEKKVIPLFIPTVHYIGGKIFEIRHAHPKEELLFIITACEMTLEMFGDWGNMVDIKGIGVRLDGRICNTMKAFELSERGIKPGLTVVLEETQSALLALIRQRREHFQHPS